MKFLIYIILITFSFSSLYANSNYVKVTNTKSKVQLRAIKVKLNSLGLKMIFKTSSRYYSVYSGPYRTKKQTYYAYKKIKRYFPNARLLTSSRTKKPTILKSKKVKNFQKEQNYYAALSFNYTSVPSTHTILEGSVTIVEPKNTGLSVSLEGGIELKQKFSVGVGFSQFSTGDLMLSNFYGVANYKITTYKSFEPYFGAILGYSSLKWSTDPIANASQNSSNDSTSPYYGTQVGVLYKGFKYADIFAGYKCLFMQHTTTIQVDTTNISKLQHNMLHSIGVGMKYNF